jgi:hypothetical protein
MHSLIALTPLALAVPLLVVAAGVSSQSAAAEGPFGQCEAGPMREGGGSDHFLDPLTALRSAQTAQQVRIEQRVVIRITPASPATRQNLMAAMPLPPSAPRFEERGKEKCVGLEDIAAVQTGSGNRLVLYLRDRRMLAVSLEKSCLARDFYSGFYVEKSKDGRLCVSRDKLRSRTGASCEVDTMRQLVQVRS